MPEEEPDSPMPEEEPVFLSEVPLRCQKKITVHDFQFIRHDSPRKPEQRKY